MTRLLREMLPEFTNELHSMELDGETGIIVVRLLQRPRDFMTIVTITTPEDREFMDGAAGTIISGLNLLDIDNGCSAYGTIGEMLGRAMLIGYHQGFYDGKNDMEDNASK